MVIKIENIKKNIEKAIISLASMNYNKPHNIAVTDVKVNDRNIVITNNYMKTTIENIKKNPNVSLVFWEREKGWRIDGKANYHESGKWVDFVKSLKENKGYPAKGAIVIEVEKVEELI